MIDDAATPKVSVVYTYSVPEKIQKACRAGSKPVVKKISIKVIDSSDELTAIEASGGNVLKYLRRMHIASLVKVDDKRVDQDGLSAEAAFESWHPQMRNLLVASFRKVHDTDAKELEDFLKGELIETL